MPRDRWPSRTGRLPNAAIAAALLLTGCAAPLAERVIASPDIVALHGETNLNTLTAPDRIESWRVRSTATHSATGTTIAGGDYKINERGPDLTRNQIDMLRPYLIDMRGYFWCRLREWHRYHSGTQFWGTGCEWSPGVVLVFHRGDHAVRVVLCFNCNEWAFEADGVRYGSDSYGTLRPQLLTFCRQLFPGDAALRDIPLDL